MQARKHRISLAVWAALGLAIGACGGDDGTDGTGAGGAGASGGQGGGTSAGGSGQGGTGGIAGQGGAGGTGGTGGAGGAGGAGGQGGAGGGSNGMFGFAPGQRFAAASGAGNYGVAVADMNGDGNHDLIVVNNIGAFVSVQLGAGDGSFQEVHRTFLLDTLPMTYVDDSLTIVDLNGDGLLDVAVPSYYLGVVVLLGQGGGMLAPPVAYATSDNTTGTVVAVDLDNDGDKDLVTGHEWDNSVDVLLNDGAGAFPTLQTTVVSGSHRFESLAAGDVDGDNLVDVVASDWNSTDVYLFKGTANGALMAGTPIPAKRARSIALGDLTGDGRPEIILGAGRNTAPGIGVLANNGDGTFQSLVLSNPTLAANVRGLADVNGDGALDVIGGVVNTGELFVATSAAGAISPAAVLPAGRDAQAVAAADVDGDALIDLVAGNNGPGLAFLGGNGDASFQDAALSGFGAGARGIAVGDLSGDGAPDVVFGGRTFAFTSLRSAAGGGLEEVGPYDVWDEPRWLFAMDADGDAQLDVVTVNACTTPGCSIVDVALGNGDGSFQAAETQTWDFPISDTAAGDVDGDGDIDIYATANVNEGALMMVNNGDGTFGTDYPPPVDAVGLADFDGDGALDLAAGVEGFAYLWHGAGDGTFTSPGPTYLISGFSQRIAVGEFNGDGHADFVMTTDNTELITIFYGAGDGQNLTPAEIDLNAGGVESPIAADLDGDGWQDLALIAGGRVVVLRNDAGFFQAGPVMPAVRGPSSLAAADMDADGHLDLLVTSAAENELVILLNTL